MNDTIMIMIVLSCLFGVVFGFILSWICASNKIDIMTRRIDILENQNKRLNKDLSEYIAADIRKELRDE